MNRLGIERADARLAALEAVLAPAVQALQSRDAETLECQLRVAQVAAPTGAEEHRAAFITQRLARLGWHDVERDRVGNVIARRRSVGVGEAPVVCLAHLDTAFTQETSLDVTVDGARISCPGIGDNGRGLAGLLTLASVLGMPGTTRTGIPLRRPLELVFTVGEEGLGNLRGSQHYFAERACREAPLPHAVIALDGPGDATIVHHALGSRRYRISFHGAGGHSWADFGTPNAVHAAGRATAWLADVPRSIAGRVALTVSRIAGGESVNAIPSHASIDVDLRATDARALKRADVELRKVVAAAVRAESCSADGRMSSGGEPHSNDVRIRHALTSDIAMLGERPCGDLPAEHPLVSLAIAATERQGVEPVPALASTDANVPMALGIPAIAIGAGGTGGGCHTTHEWYENTNAPRGLARALAIVVGMAG